MDEVKVVKILSEAFDKTIKEAVKEFGEKKLVEAISKQCVTMVIKVGQFWRTRDGDVVQIVEDDGSETMSFKSNKDFWYDSNGRAIGCVRSKHDLIDLIQDDQPITKEVVSFTAKSLRNRILEINKERVELMKQLEELGFSMTEDTKQPLLPKVLPKDWQDGDIVMCVEEIPFLTIGASYVIERGEDSGEDSLFEVYIKKDDTGCPRWYPSYCFKFQYRP